MCFNQTGNDLYLVLRMVNLYSLYNILSKCFYIFLFEYALDIAAMARCDLFTVLIRSITERCSQQVSTYDDPRHVMFAKINSFYASQIHANICKEFNKH